MNHKNITLTNQSKMRLECLFIFTILIVTTAGQDCDGIKCCATFTDTNKCVGINENCPSHYFKC